MGTHNVHTRRAGATDQFLDHCRGNAPLLPPRRNRVTELNLALARLTLEPTEPNERAIVVEEQMCSPRVLRSTAWRLDGRR
jgi:hypothetical protein